MGKRSERKNLSKREKIESKVATKTIFFNNENYTLFVYHSDKHDNKFKTVLVRQDQGVCFEEDNYPSIGDAINQAKFAYFGIE